MKAGRAAPPYIARSMFPFARRLGAVMVAVLLPTAGRAQRRATVSGGVNDAATGAQLAGVRVQVGDRLSVVTDPKGRFTLQGVPPHVYGVRLSLHGYRPKALSVEVRKNDRRLYLAATLEPLVTPPDSLQIKGDTTSVVAYEPYVDFYRRRHLGLGYFFTSRDIERLEPAHVTDLLRTVPGVWFSYDRRGEAFVSFHLGPSAARGCEPAIYLDGARAGGGFISLDALVHPGRIEGLEVYTGLPLRPMDFPDPCAIVVWTR
jgi:hypothetical protein